MRFNVKALALTAGLFWGFAVFSITWWIILFYGLTGESTWLAVIYRGYNISILGSIIGLAWGLADGLVCGAIFGWLYNFIASRCGTKTVVAE